MLKQIIGWVLVVAGLLAIGWGVWSSFNIFTVKKPVPEIFKTPAALEITSTLQKAQQKLPGSAEEQIQKQIQGVITEQFAKMLPPDFLPRVMNLLSWSIFMGILILAGGKISNIGVKLLVAGGRT